MIFFNPLTVKYMEGNHDITKPRCGEHIRPVLWPLVISRFPCAYSNSGKKDKSYPRVCIAQ